MPTPKTCHWPSERRGSSLAELSRLRSVMQGLPCCQRRIVGGRSVADRATKGNMCLNQNSDIIELNDSSDREKYRCTAIIVLSVPSCSTLIVCLFCFCKGQFSKAYLSEGITVGVEYVGNEGNVFRLLCYFSDALDSKQFSSFRSSTTPALPLPRLRGAVLGMQLEHSECSLIWAII